ncbi:hypothetical protein PTKIN_Ptkin01aG0050800 [Pterospermum kingtungense]
MVSAASLECPVSGHRLSSVVPAKVTGDNKDFELTNMDLAMKLHYIKGVYFFEAAEGLSAYDLKTPMFQCLEFYFNASGRIRRSETGRPFIKCNDGGVRIVEAHCDKTIDEWLASDDNHSLDGHLLAYDQVLGPDLAFSPLIFVQFTWFKCGGISVGLSWAHVLGDAFSASAFINLWAQIMAGHVPSKSLQVHNPEKSGSPITSFPRKPFSLKNVDPVGDHWLTANNRRLQTHCFHVTAKQLHHMVSITCDPSQTDNISHFEVLSAVIWKSLSKTREDSGPRVVMICTNNPLIIRENQVPTNGMVLSTVEVDFSVSKGEIAELAKLIAEKRVPENGLIEELLQGNEEKSDFIVYGANLTFIDLEEANFYGLELKRQKPVFVNYTINGVGDEGAVLILPGPVKEGDNGKIVTMTLPEDQIEKLKNILQKDWNIC